MRTYIVFIGLLLGVISHTDACTTFVLQDSANIVFGRNFDYDLGVGFVVVNKRGVEKQAIVHASCIPARWTARYGSVTFNQVGIDAPMGGMNEKGLVIAQMALPETEYPQDTVKPVLNQLEWIQYQLDCSASFQEVVENNRKISIVPVATPVHYFICDRSGNKGIIEFLNGRLIILQGEEVIAPVCSNMSYEKSKIALHEYRDFGGQKAIPEHWGSIADIITITASKIKAFKNRKHTNAVDYGFEILTAVGSSERTQWSVIYDIASRCIYFKTNSNKKIRTIDLNRLDFSCDLQIPVSDIQSNHAVNDSILQFRNLEKEDYYAYKRNLVNWFKQHVEGFPEIPEALLRVETEYIFNRKCIINY